MLYAYPGIDASQIIKKYQIINSSIKITYLDDSDILIPFTKINEEKILNKMLNQAEERSQSPRLEEILNMQKDTKFKVVAAALGLINGANLYENLNHLKASMLITTFFIGMYLSLYLREAKSLKLETIELQKYDLFLKMQADLASFQDENKIDLFNGIKNNINNLNINTIDSISLKDLQKINHNIQKLILKKR